MPKIMINGCNLAYEAHGTGQNTVLFLHDLFFNGRSFNQQIVALRDRFQCITLDLRGHGDSGGGDSDVTLETLAQDVNQLINISRYGACHIVGAGFGGAVAVRAALDQPARTNSLTLIGSSLGEINQQDVSALKQRRLHMKLFGTRFVNKALMRRAFSSTFLSDPANDAQVNHFRLELRKLDRKTIPRTISAYLARPNLLDELYKLKHPAFIAGGTLDSVITYDDITQVSNRLSPSMLLQIEEAGHAVHIERPNALNSELLAFLQSI